MIDDPLPFETHHFLPDNTVYDTESGSYLDSYSSFKQTRAPVVLMYWKKYIYIKLHVVLASYTGRHGRLTTKTFAEFIQVIWKCCVCLRRYFDKVFFLYIKNNKLYYKQPKTTVQQVRICSKTFSTLPRTEGESRRRPNVLRLSTAPTTRFCYLHSHF